MSPLPFPSPPFLKALLQPGPDFVCVAHMNNPLSCCRVKNGVPVVSFGGTRGSCWGAEAARSLFLPFFPPPCRRQPRLPRCWAAVTGSPRCSLLWTLFFLAPRSPRHLKTESNSKALLASFLASAPPFLSRNSLWIKSQYSLLKALGYNVKVWIARALFSVHKWQMFAAGTAGKTHPGFLQREVKVQPRFWVETWIPVDHLLHILMTFKHNQIQLILEKQGAILSSRGRKCWAPLKSLFTIHRGMGWRESAGN